MNNKKNTVIVLSGSSENNAINFAMTLVSNLITVSGLNVEYFDLSNDDANESIRFFKVISSGTVKFGITWCGIGQSIRTFKNKLNVWELFDIPLLKLHGDSPAHYPVRHLDGPYNSVNVYGWEEHWEFNKFINEDSRCISGICGPTIMYDMPESEIDIKSRKSGKLFFLKNGVDPAVWQSRWRGEFSVKLSKQLCDLSVEVLSNGLKPGKLAIHEIVIAYLEEHKIEIHRNSSLLCLYVRELDGYLRGVKATMVAQALLPFPVIIQGEGWDHLDTAGAKATIAPSQGPSSTEVLYRTMLGVIDMSPNTDTGPHDRMCRAAGTYSFALTNRATWLKNLMPALHNAAYHFHPDQIQDAVNNALKDPDSCIDLGRQYGRVFRDTYDHKELVGKLSTLAEMAQIIKVERIEAGLHYDLCEIDQTATATAECAVEINMRKKNQTLVQPDPCRPFPAYVELTESQYGPMLYPPKDQYVGRSLKEYGQFSQGEFELFTQFINTAAIVLDIGANIGAHTIPLAQLVGPGGVVVAFEPQPVLYKILCANLVLNSVPNVLTYAMALGNCEGECLIPELDYSESNNFGGIGMDMVEEGVPVPLGKLDDFEMERVDFIKIDVEGFESKVLEGAVETIKRCMPIMYIENDRANESAELIQRLFDMNYRLWWHTPPLYSPENFKGNKENVFPGIVSINMLAIHRDMRPVSGLREITAVSDTWK